MTKNEYPGGWINPMGNFGPHSSQWLGHSFRYYLASGFLKDTDTVLDASCGVGYGSKILSERCFGVLGMDIDDRALAIAKEKYNRKKIQYISADFDEISRLPRCDVAVSFETIEHLKSNPQRWADMLKASANRMIIASTPVVPTVGVNPYHLHDFTFESFQALFLDDSWVQFEYIRQGVYGVIIVYNREKYEPDNP